MGIEQPYHAGELAVQHRAGEQELAVRHGKGIARRVMPGAPGFIARQPMVVLGSVGRNGAVWASVLFGGKGFAAADEETVTLDLTRVVRHDADPLWYNIKHDTRIGMLFIELVTRRRLRVNGSVARQSPERLEITVREAYGNCSKYIQRRNAGPVDPAEFREAPKTREGVALDPGARRLIQAADTLFVASAHPERGVDASHRGGPPGFVRIRDDRTLRIPDYQGNSMFNTLGNFAVHPDAGLAFLGFEGGAILQITGRVTLHFDLEDPAGDSGGTNRFWDFTTERWLLSEGAVPMGWEFLDYSTALPSPLAPGGRP